MGKTSFIDMTGNKYGLLTVLELSSQNNGAIKWLCRCDCGNEVIVAGNNLKNGHTKSCGCYRRKRTIETHTTHGGNKTRLYRIWTGMKTRCYNKNCRSYKDYGERGITMCAEWLGKNGFMNFMNWAYLNGYSDDLSIDRIDVSAGYSPDNCRWADVDIQANNRSVSRFITINGISKTLAEWAKITGLKSGTLRYRIDKMHLSPEEAIKRDLTLFNGRKIEYKGKYYTFAELSRMLNIKRQTIEYRYNHGVPLDKELNNKK